MRRSSDPGRIDLKEALVAVLVVAASICWGCTPTVVGEASSTPPAVDSDRPSEREGRETGMSEPSDRWDEDWSAVEGLVSEQKFEAAAEKVAAIRESASEAGLEADWTRALVREVQLRTALHGYETAVRLLMERPWPENPFHRAVLELFYANGLVTYVRSYSWEIEQRERFDTGDEVDLRSWTLDQILEEAHTAYARVWEQRDAWGGESLGSLAEYLSQNNYPARIRGTLRDAVTYLWVELLSDSSFWRPGQENQLHRLDLAALAAGDPETSGELSLTDPAVQPLLRIGALLDDLEAWHQANRRPEAAFEARLERLRRLHGSFTRDEDRELLRVELARALDELGSRWEWWSVGQAFLAEMVRQVEAPDSLVRAREIALAGQAAHPDSIGGLRCRHLVAAIEAPAWSMQAMSHDGPGRRSVKVDHKNVAELHFRAYELSLLRRVESARDYNLLPGYREVPDLMERLEPAVEWSLELPATPDFRSHVTYVEPPLDDPGLYVVVASTRRDFRVPVNRQAAVNLIVGDLVLVTRQEREGFEVTVRSGGSGRALEGVEVRLYRFDYRGGHVAESVKRSRADGRARFAVSDRGRNVYFVVALDGDDAALDTSHLRIRSPHDTELPTSALVYTDRSVYRPLQTIQWKVVGYAGGEESRFQTLAGADIAVDLVDPNGEVVAQEKVTTNRFGSASGEFPIPTGRLLGGWTLQTSFGGHASVQVEEYKRPTFEVSILDPEEELRLNREAELTGEVRYYFGLPVVSGSVAWRVDREPVYPRWWWWGPPEPATRIETVAGGDADLDEEGRFRIRFLPEADEREASSSQVTYRYRLSAEVTDDGGETRSGSRSFRLGFVAVEADLEPGAAFFTEAGEATWRLSRNDLDGIARPGAATWRLVSLSQPETTPLPADLPAVRPPVAGTESSAFRTPGDLLRPRWSTGVSPHEILRGWDDGAEVRSGSLEHGEDGVAGLELAGLAAGAYRLHYRTLDDFGAAFETSREFLVVPAAERGGESRLALPLVLMPERVSVPVGETARLLIHSGLAEQELVFEVFRDGRRVERRVLEAEGGPRVIEVAVGREHRGGFGLRVSGVRDHQHLIGTSRVFVPWDDRELSLEFESFRDRMRPGGRETWRVRVSGADERALGAGAAEVLAYMYDRSLDIFAAHRPPRPLSLYPDRTWVGPVQVSLGSAGEMWRREESWVDLPGYPNLHGDRLRFFDGYAIGGMGSGRAYHRGGVVMTEMAMAEAPIAMESMAMDSAANLEEAEVQPAPPAPSRVEADGPPDEPPGPGEGLRTDFSETAFWEPHLVLEADGGVAFEFTVPDSVTEWSVWVHALTRDLRSGSLEERSRSVKELMVRPYLPRFLREGDRASIKVVVNNAGEEPLSGTLDFEILDPATDQSLLAEFGLGDGSSLGVAFEVAPGGGADLSFPVEVPARVGTVAFRVKARAGDLSDGEIRPLPLLPGRMHLSQSRFVTLRDEDRRELHFADMAADDDPSLLHEQLVVTLDAQLFYGVLNALPYLVSFPYECTEQSLNRFLSTGIVSSIFDAYPSVASMARKLSRRETRFETWDAADPNRKMALEETPWLVEARGGDDPAEGLINVLDPRIAAAERDVALAKLEKAQTSLGAFPWWPGGPPSPWMTLYILHGFSKGLEFGVEVPREMVVRAWSYMHRHYLDEVVRRMMAKDCCWETVTFLNYVLSSYPDPGWTGGVFTEGERREMLDFSFRHWKSHSPLLKAYLSLTLQRADRADDARLVFDSVMDSAKTTDDEGTFWAPEDRAWLWYNDTIESHAFALRTLIELEPDDARRHGLVQWLFLNKKLNHWKSTRATAEVIYALIHYLEREGTLAVREVLNVSVGPVERRFVFEPDEFSGARNRVVVRGDEIDSGTMSTIVVEKETPGFAFASATWSFSTEELPEEARGDFFAVERRYFRRHHTGDEWVLQPLAEGDPVAVGDQVEVHLSIRAKHAAEYVHLRDPRGAGFEPESTSSSYKWDLGIGWYEEVRDSGTNFFFEWLPRGEYNFKYRLRASMAGTFKIAPATLQSMYAPEFNAYSAGKVVAVASDR